MQSARIENAEQYAELIARNARHQEWSKQFVKPNGWTFIPGEQRPPAGAEMSNAERSAIEVWEWNNDKPEHKFAYVKLPADGRKPGQHHFYGATGELTTWTGDKLGTIQFGRTWRDNFGGTRVSISVYATNGATYHGTYFASSGDYARIKKAKRA